MYRAGTFDTAKLHQIKLLGFNRVSLGVQSFDDTVLSNIGRVHNAQDVFNSVQMIRDEGITNFSIDLISGLPGMTLAGWATTLELAANLHPSHMSVYDLQIEEGTTFGKWYKSAGERDDEDGDDIRGVSKLSYASSDAAPLPTPAESAFMYKYASGYLRAREYNHYEISSYAATSNDAGDKKLNRSKHNSIYWEPNSNWLGETLKII